jgi:ZIP family zinc transporter
MTTENIILAFLLTLVAGLSTGIGGLIAFFSKRDNVHFLTLSLGFSAGVMLFVSFVDIFPAALEGFTLHYTNNAMLATCIAFFAGMALIALIDFLIPEGENPHEMNFTEQVSTEHNINDTRKFHRMGIMLALSIAIHNFPEGLATFAVSLNDISMALPIVLAIALHNIPEGIAVAVPIYQATGSRWKALLHSLLSGLSEPLGALAGFLILMPFWNSTIEAAILGITAGIMVYISLDELLPTSERYGHHHLSILGVIAGMALMAISLIIIG